LSLEWNRFRLATVCRIMGTVQATFTALGSSPTKVST
jgi:hypothetical protein